MTDTTCMGWDGTKWTNKTTGASGKGSNPANHAEQAAYGKQKSYVAYRFEQSTFPCDEKAVGSCHKTFLKYSEGGKVSFIFSVEKNVGHYPVPGGTNYATDAPASPAPETAVQKDWDAYKIRKQDWAKNPFVVVASPGAAESGDLYYFNGKAYFGAKPIGFPV